MATTQHEIDHESSRRRPRLLRFSVRTLLVLLTFLCYGQLAVQAKRARDQKHVVAAILDIGGSVRYDWQPSVYDLHDRRVQIELAAQAGRPKPTFIDEPCGPAWLRNLIGDEFFQHVAEVQLIGTNVYTGRVPISEEALTHITSVRELEGLILTTTDTSDADLEQIGKLRSLQYLLILNGPITDAGLVHLRSLHNLVELQVRETEVTQEGVENLRKYLPNCRISF